jgi:hypothetical protein
LYRYDEDEPLSGSAYSDSDADFDADSVGRCKLNSVDP